MCTNGLSSSRGCHISSLKTKSAGVAMAIGTLAMLGLALPSAHASLLVYEPFNYAAGTANGVPANGLGLAGSWSFGNALIASGSLHEGNLATSGNSLSGGASNGTDVNLSTPIAATVGHPLWVSFLMKTPATTAEVTSGWGGLTLELSPNASVFTYPFIGYANGGVFVVQTQGGGNDVNGSSVNANTTYLMVLEDVANSSGPDTLSLWVNPAAGGTSPSGTPNITDNLVGPIGNIYGIGTNDGPSSVSYDEIRIGTTYTDVTPSSVPEPASLGLVAAGGLGLLLLKRRKAV